MKPRASRSVYSGRLFDVTKNTFLFEGAKYTRDVVEHPGSVAVVPLLPGANVILIRQFRFPAGRYIWEIPAGTLDRKESLSSCAKRELREETGYKPRRVARLCDIYLAPGYSTERIRLFVATGLSKVRKPPADDDPLTVHVITMENALKMVKTGKINDAKTVIGLFLASGILT